MSAVAAPHRNEGGHAQALLASVPAVVGSRSQRRAGLDGLRGLAEDLAARGVQRLMVEGGGKVHTQFWVPRLVSDGRFPWNAGRRALLAEVRQIGDVVLLCYALSPRFETD